MAEGRKAHGRGGDHALRCFECLRKADGGKHVSDCGECNAFERFTKDIVEVVRVVVEGGEEDKELGKANKDLLYWAGEVSDNFRSGDAHVKRNVVQREFQTETMQKVWDDKSGSTFFVIRDYWR